MYDVVVVGGGFAGATALRESARLGHRTVLLEARDRLGGRAWFDPDALPGVPGLEMGCQFFNSDYSHVFGEITRYGVPYHVYAGGLDGTHWIQRDGSVHEGPLPVNHQDMSQIEDLVVALRAISDAIDLAVPWAEQFPAPDGARLDVSVDEWLQTQGASEDLRHLVSLALAPWLVSRDDERSLLYLARMVAADNGLYRYLAGDNVILENGTTDLVERIAQDAQAEIRLSTPVTSVRQGDGSVTLRTPEGEVPARAVVWAAPIAVLADVFFTPALDERRLLAAASRSHGEGSKVWALVRGVPAEFFALGPVERLHSLVRVDELPRGTALVVGFGSGSNWLDGTDREAVQQEIRRWFPTAEVVASTGYNWPADPWTRNASPFPRPGDAMKHDAVLTKPEGRVFFAGGDISLTRPGFVDGAIETGLRAARDVSEFLEREGAMS